MQSLIRSTARFALAFCVAATSLACAAQFHDIDPDLAPDALGPPVAAYPASDIVWMLRLGTFDAAIPVTIEPLNNGGPMQWSPNCDPMSYTEAAGTIPPGTAYLCIRTIAGGVNAPFQYRVTIGPWQALAEYTASYAGSQEHLDIVTGPNPVTSSTTATFTLFANDNPVFECSLDGSEFAPCASPVSYADLAPGTHTFTARATGNPFGQPMASDPATRTWIVDPAIAVPAEDTSVPDTAILNANYTEVQSYFVSYFFDDDVGLGRTFECSMDAAPFIPCPRMSTWGGLADGPHALQVRSVNSSGVVDPTPATIAFNVNTQAPHITLDTYPPAESGSPSAQFTFHFSKAPYGVQCSLNGAAWANCSSGVTYGNLVSGNYTFRVRAWDSVGHVDPPTSYSWTVSADLPPETTIVSGPASPLFEGTAATFTFTSNAPGATFECRFTGTVAFAPCASPWTTPLLPPATYVAEVRATDAQGRVDPTPATRSFTVIAEPLRITFDSTPPPVTTQQFAMFSFHLNKPPQGVQCSLNGAPFTSCASPVAYPNLAPGSYTFQVMAWNAGSSVQAGYSWSVQAVVPDTIIQSGPAPGSQVPVGTPAIYAFTSTVPGAVFQCRVVNITPMAPCASPWTVPALPPGNYSVEVQAIAQGQPDPTPAVRTFSVVAWVDTIITASPPSDTTSTTATFAFMSVPSGLMFDCKMDGGVWMACASPRVYPGLSRQIHTFQVRARNSQGQADATPAAYTWMIH